LDGRSSTPTICIRQNVAKMAAGTLLTDDDRCRGSIVASTRCAPHARTATRWRARRCGTLIVCGSGAPV
jgi:gluconate kinase